MVSNKKLIDIDGEQIFIEIDEDKIIGMNDNSLLYNEENLKFSLEDISKSLKPIFKIGKKISDEGKNLKPDEIEVELGFDISLSKDAKLLFCMVKGETKAAIKVKLKWDIDKDK